MTMRRRGGRDGGRRTKRDEGHIGNEEGDDNETSKAEELNGPPAVLNVGAPVLG